MASSAARPVRAVLASYLLTVISRAADIVFFLVVFGALPVSEVAEFSLAAAIAAFFSVAVDFGVNTVVLREFSTGSLTLARGSAVGGAIRAVTIPVAMLLVMLWMQLNSSADLSFHAVQLACAVQILVLAEVHCYQWLRSQDAQVFANSLSTLDCLFKAGCMLVLAGLGELSSAERVFGVQLGYHLVLLSACVLVVVTRRSGEAKQVAGEPVTSAASMLRGAVPLAAVGLITALQNRFDWILVAQFLDENVLAIYSVANRAYEILLLMAGTAAVTTYPYLCRDVSTGSVSSTTSLLRGMTLSCGVLGAGMAAILLPFAFEHLWPGKYTDARVPLQYLMAVACMSCVVMTLYYETAARRAESAILAISIGATVVQLAANFILIPRIGMMGAVIGMGCLISTSAVAYALLARMRWATAVPVGKMLAYGAGGAIACIVITSARAALPVALVSLLAVWSVATWFGLLNAADRARIRSTVATRLPRLTNRFGIRSP